MRIEDVPDGDIEPEPERRPESLVWQQIINLREACELFIDLRAPDPDAENADREEDERVIRQQVQAAVAVAQASLNLLAADIFSLYGDATEGE